MNYKERMRIEYDELYEKTNKLKEFMNGPHYHKVSQEERVLLRLQHQTMTSYILILNERLCYA